MSEGRKYQTHITHTTPADSPICCGINKMSESEKTGMKMLFETAYLNAKKGDHIQTSKTGLNGQSFGE